MAITAVNRKRTVRVWISS